jgi:hypothetical protein
VHQAIHWNGYWIILGILSSVGLGTGLHTFLLFLGPHIAQVTAAAYACGHLDFVSATWKEYGESIWLTFENTASFALD